MEIAQSLKMVPSSYIREILEAASAPDVISLAGGLPDKSTFPVELMKPSIEALVNQDDIFQYGNTAGYAPLIAHLRNRYGLIDEQQVLVTTGSQQGLDLVARAFINPADKIVMEAPSYLGAMQVFGLAQADIKTVTQNDNGPDLAELEACFIQHKPKLFYSVPDFHNPTGISWDLAVRKAVAELCIRYNVTLIEDAPYKDLRFSGEDYPLVSSFCQDRSIVLRSFSKIASPGLRVGVAIGPSALINPMTKVKQGADLHSSYPIQSILLGLLTHPEFESHLNDVRHHYYNKYQHMEESLNKHLPEGSHFSPVQGGMFVWVKIPSCDTMELATQLLSHKVAVVPSCVFYPQHTESKPALRLNFTNASEDEIETAIEIMSKVIRDTIR